MDDKAQLVTEEDRRLLQRVGDLLEEVIETLEITGSPETMREVEEARRDAREGRVRDYSELREELRKAGKIRAEGDLSLRESDDASGPPGRREDR